MNNDVVLKVENISKQYRLGEVGTGTLSHDLNRWWHKVRGKEDPYTMVGDVNDRTITEGESEYVWALKNINFEVKEGDILGIIGKNGAGKSTLLKILSRVTGPTTGSIKVKGRVASLLEVGTGFHPELTGRENIYLNGAILGMTKAEVKAKLDEIVEFSGCAKYVDTPVKRYSSGMMVRLGFAVAAHLEPEILVVDEVLAVGDAEFQKKAVGKMKEVSQGGGRTVLFVSHNMTSIENLCNQCILMKNGTIQNIGPTKEIINQYLNQESTDTSLNVKKFPSNSDIDFISFLFKDDSGQNFSYLKSGQKINFCFEFKIKRETIINLNVAFGIFDNSGKRITRISMRDKGERTITKSRGESAFVDFEFKRLPLASGTYFMTVGVFSDHNPVHIWQHIISFSVEDGDYYDYIGSGNDLRWGPVLVDFNYNLR